MNRFVANTLRTLGLIAVAVFVIAIALGVALLGLCFSILSQSDNHNHPSPQAQTYLHLGIFAAIGVLIGGIVIIAILARLIFHESNIQDQTLAPDQKLPLTAPYPLIPPPPRPPTPPAPPAPQPRAIATVATHLSPASAATIQQLAVAIVAKIAAEVALGMVGYNGALGTPRAPFPLYQTGFMLWGIAAIAPHLILLIYLFRKPGRTTFAYALIIPSLHLLLGLIGHSAFLAFILRPGQIAAPLLSIIPWILDLLILYLAWKVIRQTGIHPDPPRLLIAAAVIVLYTTLLPTVVVILNYVHTHPL
jgi:hypothetical protein